MPRIKITSQTRLAALMPGAVAGGYTIERIAKECGCGRKAAASALRAYQAAMAEEAAVEAGGRAEEMRAGVTAERLATVERLGRLGSLCDELLSEAEGRLCGAVDSLGRVGGVRDGIEAAAGLRCSLDDLERISGILAKAARVASDSWRLFRSASGLEMAENLTEMKARQRIQKADDDGSDVWEADFTLIEPGP